MAYLNLSNLGSFGFQTSRTLNADVQNYNPAARYHIFLSYRHADRNYVPGVVKFLKDLHAGVYVDFLDEELANSPNSRTAPIIRQRISDSRKLIQLLSPNSNDSRWMPWELGLGDGLLKYPNAVTLPATTTYNQKIPEDFLAMYGHIESTRNSYGPETWIVKYPEGTSKSFTDWLRM